MEQFDAFKQPSTEPLAPPVLPEGEKLTESNIPAETFSFFENILHSNDFEEYIDVNAAYHELGDHKLIVRREDPRNILKLLSDAEQYDVTFVGDKRYSNCVEWSPSDGSSNIQNAYLEGYTHINGVVTVIGIEKSAEDDLVALEDAAQDFYGLQRQGVRSFTGTVTKDRIAFVSLRIPGHLLPESALTEDELDKVDEYIDAIESGQKKEPIMVHRVFLPSQKEEIKEAA